VRVITNKNNKLPLFIFPLLRILIRQPAGTELGYSNPARDTKKCTKKCNILLNKNLFNFRFPTGVLLLVISFQLQFCSEKVISSDAGDISAGSFQYLKEIFYGKNYKISEIIEDIKKLEAEGILASRYGLQKNKHYKKFLLLERRARFARAAAFFWKKKYHSEFNIPDAINYYKIKINPDIAVNIISKQIRITSKIPKNFSKLDEKDKIKIKKKRREYLLRDSPDDIILGSWSDGKITLEKLQQVMLPYEWKQLLSLAPSAMKPVLLEHLKLWINKLINDEVMDALQAQHEELERFDHNRLAALYLRVKYELAGEGIFPTESLKIKFHPTELYKHFQKTKRKYLRVKKIRCQFVIVKNNLIAEKFFKELKSGKNFEILTYQYAVKYVKKYNYKKYAKPFIVNGYLPNIAPEKQKPRSYFEKIILESVRINHKNPEPVNTPYGIMLIRILNIDFYDKNIRLQNYLTLVERDLTTEHLREQYPVQIDSLIQELDFYIHPDLLK
jgi:hypothetical protein